MRNKQKTSSKKIRVVTDHCSGKDRRKEFKMKILHTLKVIELTASEMKQACKYGSDMYKQLVAARNDFPGFEVKEAKKVKKSKNDFSDLKMKDIKAYVEKRGTEEQKSHFNFISKRTITEEGEYVEPQSFLKIKEWFLNEFPELKKSRKEYREKIEKIYEEAAAKAEAAA